MTTTGEITILGKNIYDPDVSLSELRKTVGMVFQRPNPLPISIYENVLFGIRVHTPRRRLAAASRRRSWSKRPCARCTSGTTSRTGCARRPRTLTLEQQQKLCIARLLPLKPRVILMDEPCSALDAEGIERIEELLDGLREQYTIVIVTHNMAQARRASDECIFMLLGELIEHGADGTGFLQSAARSRRKCTSKDATGNRRDGAMKKFDNELAAIQKQLSEMADLARSMVYLTAAAVKDRTRDVQTEIYGCEGRLNKMQTQIDHEAIRMLTVYGPVAKDLRFVLVCTHVTSQLERMGDQVVNVIQSLADDAFRPCDAPLLPNLEKMADLVCEMVDDALDAYFSQNSEKAVITRQRDDVVDAMNDQVMKELLTDDVLRQVLSGATRYRRRRGPNPDRPLPGADRRPGDERLQGSDLHGQGRRRPPQTPQAVGHAGRGELKTGAGTTGIRRAILPAFFCGTGRCPRPRSTRPGRVDRLDFAGVRRLQMRRLFVFAFDGLVHLLTVDGHVRWRLYPQPHFVAADIHDRDYHVVANDDAFVTMSRQHQHRWLLMSLLKLTPCLPAERGASASGSFAEHRLTASIGDAKSGNHFATVRTPCFAGFAGELGDLAQGQRDFGEGEL